MAKFNIGDKVKIRDQADWPKPPGFRFANAEGTVAQHEYPDMVMSAYEHLVFVKLEKAGESAKEYVGNAFWFLTDQVEKK